MLTLTDVLDLLPYELSCLGARRLALTFIFASPLDGLLFWHVNSPMMRHANAPR